MRLNGSMQRPPRSIDDSAFSAIRDNLAAEPRLDRSSARHESVGVVSPRADHRVRAGSHLC
jgi:hypothetical protein